MRQAHTMFFMTTQRVSSPSHSIEERVGTQVTHLRKSLGMTQRDFAAALTQAGMPVDASAVSRIEKGTRALRLSEAVTLASVLDVDLRVLTQGIESPDQEFAALRRYAQSLMDHAQEATFYFLTSNADAANLIGEVPTVLSTLTGAGAPKTAAEYLPWVASQIATIEVDEDLEILSGDEDEARRLRAVGYALVDRIVPTEGHEDGSEDG